MESGLLLSGACDIWCWVGKGINIQKGMKAIRIRNV